MKPFNQLIGIEKAAEVAYVAWEAEMVKFAEAFLSTLREELGWPEDRFMRLVFENADVPAGGRRAPGGYVDGSGYHFAARLGLSRSWVQAVFAVRRVAEDYEVKIGDEAFTIALDRSESFAPIMAGISREMTKTILLREVAAQTEYAPESSD
jgi:hypothetical protein